MKFLEIKTRLFHVITKVHTYNNLDLEIGICGGEYYLKINWFLFKNHPISFSYPLFISRDQSFPILIFTKFHHIQKNISIHIGQIRRQSIYIIYHQSIYIIPYGKMTGNKIAQFTLFKIKLLFCIL